MTQPMNSPPTTQGPPPQPAPAPTGADYLTNLAQTAGNTPTAPTVNVDPAAGLMSYSIPTSASTLQVVLSQVPIHDKKYGSYKIVAVQDLIYRVDVYVTSFQEMIDYFDLVKLNHLYDETVKKQRPVGHFFSRVLDTKPTDFVCAHASIPEGKTYSSSRSLDEKYTDTFDNVNCNHATAESYGGPFSACKMPGDRKISSKEIFGFTGACNNFSLDIREIHEHPPIPALTTEGWVGEAFFFYALIRNQSGINPYIIKSTSKNPFDEDSYEEILPWEVSEVDTPNLIADRPIQDSFLTSVGVQVTS
jgi:hypothetical protein